MKNVIFRKRGRPRKPDDEKLVVQIHVDLNLADAASLRRICEKKHITKAEYFRDCIKNTTYELDRNDEYYENMYDFWDTYDENDGENEEEDD